MSKRKEIQVDAICYLQQLKDHYSNKQADEESDLKDIEMQYMRGSIESRIKDFQTEINKLTNCIDWLTKL